MLPTTFISITSTTIIGSVHFPVWQAAAYNVNVTTVDGGIAPKSGFICGWFRGNTDHRVPHTGLRVPNTTVNFTVTGTNFEQGVGKTMVAFTTILPGP